MKTGIFILSGYNIRAVVALCRWAVTRSVAIYIVAMNSDDPIYLTQYQKHVFLERNTPHLTVAEFCRWIETLQTRYHYDHLIIAPSTEFLNRFLLDNRFEIERSGGIIPIVRADLYIAVSDKYAFGKLCTKHGIDIPIEFNEPLEVFPFVAKPRSYASINKKQLKPYLIHTPEDRDNFIRMENCHDYYFQEFVEGHSIYLLAHISKKGVVITCAQENLMQQPCGGSIILAKRHPFDSDPASQQYVSMLSAIAFHGLIMIEVRLCKRTGRYVMIEANPRMWGPLQFVLDQHVDLLGALISDHGLDTQPPIKPDHINPYYFWSGGLPINHNSIVWHNFSASHFIQNFKDITAADLFCRDDTLKLYKQELSS